MGQPAMQPDPPEIVVEAGIDRRQLEGLLELHKLWAEEEYGNHLNVDVWAHNTTGKVGSGQWTPAIAWCGDEAVGTVEVFIQDDAAALERRAYGDQAFVREAWRGAGVYRALYEAVHSIARLMGATEGCIPVGATDEAGKFLKPMYEKEGYRVTGYLLRRTL